MSNFANILNDLLKSPAPTSPPRGGKYTKREWTGERWRYYYADSAASSESGKEDLSTAELDSSWPQEKQIKWSSAGKTAEERIARREKVFQMAEAAKKTASEEKKQNLDKKLAARNERIQFEKQRNNEAAASLKNQPFQAIPGEHPSQTSTRQLEHEIFHLPHEVAGAVDASGNVLFKTEGAGSAVEISKEQIAMLNGAVLTHNHPFDTEGWTPGSPTLSAEDLVLASDGGVSEMRAIGILNGQKVLYSVKPSENGWGFDPAEIAGQYQQVIETLKPQFEQKILEGSMDSIDYSHEIQHATIQQLAQTYGFQYDRTFLNG